MAWSTRQLAELAGTTLKTVRYYHKVGLLDEPERAANGYKQSQIRHLIRLLRIRRLVGDGCPMWKVAPSGRGGRLVTLDSTTVPSGVAGRNLVVPTWYTIHVRERFTFPA
ncbi:MerR family DNA-binding transcriptional regulator [Saccharopolyspora sp. 5N102]|uniref:MerR family DNA-binding transcriptional regulator n=1 Tax=Saccharopolyspora sp. 5N102 TaxID=3375155 RepID=UPI0037945E73